MASSNNYVPLVWNEQHSFHCELKINKQGDRIPVDSGEKQKTKTWIKKDGFKSGIRLNIRLKISRNILG